MLRYGLCVGSSDLIGVLRIDRARIISGPSTHVALLNQSIGRFVALECKRPGEQLTEEQERFLALVRCLGGFACVVTSPEEALAAIERARQGQSE
jgi:hypothetical protein